MVYGILAHQQPVLARVGFLSSYDLFFGAFNQDWEYISAVHYERDNTTSWKRCYNVSFTGRNSLV